ncbi:bifunctional alpha,alpha-trehalose-phosphate synthase (UDP-forming)/trehalose-phosphatase [Pseudochryseolinea flava]|uniref:Bifunctional alpha,alpha-trehalose-phosphate synthase (UDP-forming)/trehalose-phosphatase n=1 Tax=Pseudochryseolinea flava TaxID=2059302 RepID=A0A364Y561_9BACT|nr:bifunctional alpha,alpha-trehalose-phosphate synthase (UDP-forming)/trehalose-phosphatase [Pseudochryseolinea flava]RAW01889.1 bifunctional alpha,alpha-trehalose-phosphate synthase (UDP-forming)/trehalose-phosphatase [Pseudochryseolinea flava]
MSNEKPRRLVVVSNRLPFQLQRKNGKVEMRQSDGGLVSALKSYFENEADDHKFSSVLWIGSAEFSEKRWTSISKRQLESLPYQPNPIFFDKKLYNKFYNGFCNATLWPLFHYFPSFVEFDNDTFKAYEEVNRIFADAVCNCIQEGDVVWIHDYQLMLVPSMIRQKYQHAIIGFFLHIPFPSFEIFRLLNRPWKEKIIEGLLGADLIGFHTHEYVQHFLKTVRMIKGFDHHFRTILLPDTTVKAEMFPLGIDFNKFASASKRDDVIEIKNAIAENFSSKKIIFSVDRLDYTKGVNHRLKGFETFLERYPDWREKVVFVLVVVPSRQIISKYNERKKMIEEEIGRINGKYSTLQWQPVIYRYSNLSFQELTAMYDVADIGLITPLRDGMNLVAKEYVASKSDKGVLILSELAGAANELGEAILVNPFDRDELAESIFRGLNLDDDTQRLSIQSMQARLQNYTTSDWLSDFIQQLDDVKQEQRSQQTNLLKESSRKEILYHFKHANRRLFLLDYDGTLVPFAKHPSLATPNPTVISTLNAIASFPNTDVMIISGRDRGSLEKWFGNLPVTLVSEHGAAVRHIGGKWVDYVAADQSWKDNVRPTLEIFHQRSPGSFIEEKRHTMAWHYRNVDPELGFIRSRELVDSLHHMLRNVSLQIIDGNKVIEIRIPGINKGEITKNILQGKDFDFILAIGDDKTDEDMFRILDHSAYTLKIGPGHTIAKFHINEQRDVLPLLHRFCNSVEN